MSITIENRSGNQVLLRLNSGLTRRLAPGQKLEGVESVEVKGNDRIQRLVERRIIAMGDGPAMRRVRSGDMKAEDAVERIRSTPLDRLADFLSPDESRVTVLRAMEEKRNEA